MVKRISILGVTGSIGANTVRVIEDWGVEEFETVAVTGHGNIAGLADAARRLNAEIAVTADPDRLEDLRAALAGSGISVAAGPQAIVEAASRPVDWCMAAIVGAACLAPTLAAARTGAVIAQANKECLVAAGPIFLAEMARSGARLLPVDSEHNAIFQLVAAEKACPIERLILTASGGPFRTRTAEEMANVTVAEAVAHPNWSMGARISIDSASMFNKALEMVEAGHLF
ncbi:MAG: 1-deoxy-D-xylulose-5-phosphate reductoisomerase, partial [Pseudomonadota bacterium]